MCSGIDQPPVLFPPFFTLRSTEGGGGMAPSCPISYASDTSNLNITTEMHAMILFLHNSV